MARLTIDSTEAVFSAKLTVPAGMWASGQETLLAYFRAHNEKFDKRVGVNRWAVENPLKLAH